MYKIYKWKGLGLYQLVKWWFYELMTGINVISRTVETFNDNSSSKVDIRNVP